MGGVTKRSIEVGTDTCLLGFSGRSYIQSAAFDASTLAPAGGVNEQQVVTITGSPSGGTLKLKYRGQQTGTIAFDASAATVQTALRALTNIGATGVTVAGSSGGPWTVTFAGPLAAQDVFMLQLGTNALTGGTAPSATVAQTVQGVTYDPRILVGSANYPGTLVSKTGSTPNQVREYTAAGGVAEAQTLTITGSPSGGTFKLAYRGDVTADIPRNETAANVAIALNALDTITEDGGVVGSGGAFPGTPVVITFNEVGARPSITLNTNAMTGGTTPTLTPSETTAGVDPEAIWGIVDGVEEFIEASKAGSRDITVYVTQLVLDCSKIKNFAAYQQQVEAWARANFNMLRFTS